MAGQVSAGTVQALRETRPWVLFLAILGITSTGLMLLGGISVLLFGAFASSSLASASGSAGVGFAGLGLTAVFGLVFLALALFYLYPIIKLFKYAGAINRLSRSGSVKDLEGALREQKSFWKFNGIVTVVILVLYFLAFMGGLVGSMALPRGGSPPLPSSRTLPAPFGPP
jgi:hypothetical protein